MRGVDGFRFAAVDAGLKKGEGCDVALAVSDEPVPAVGVFTRNLVRAAPCELAAERLSRGVAQALLVNSGCANACTGSAGVAAAERSTAAVAREVGLDERLVIPASTGVIGRVLPADRIESRVRQLVSGLSPEGHGAFSEAILTTDRYPKICEDEAEGARLLGIGKGAGMFHPDLATMLAFVFTDAEVGSEALCRALPLACERTFNVCTVDGDTSTNDCVVLMASGRSGIRPEEAGLVAALTRVCGALARKMVADGEGARHVVDVAVSGLGSEGEARRVARTIATSLLVKTALFGRDPNWGRILGAAGRAGVRFDPGRARIDVEGVEIVRDGVAVGAEAEQAAAERMAAPSYRIAVALGDGPGAFTYTTSDLGHGYVDVNAGYRT